MDLEINKAKTYIGFAKRARKIKYGVDDIIKLKLAELIFVSSELASSSFEKIKKFAEKTKSTMHILDSEQFNELLQSENIKAIAVLDKNLADAIKKCMTTNSLGGNLE